MVQIVQSSPGTTVSMTVAQSNAESVQALLLDLRQASINLDPQPKATADAEIATIEAQLASPSPRRALVRECLTSLRSIFEQTGAALAATKITTFLQQAGWL